MDFPTLTDEQIAVVNAQDHQFDIHLKGLEVLAIFVLGQMTNCMVRMTDTMWDKTKIGLFVIKELNGTTSPDFSNPDEWKNVELKSIEFSLISSNEWGLTVDTYRDLLKIKDISRIRLT